MTTRLFDDLERTRRRSKLELESTYSFYNEIAVPKFCNVRVLLEEWYQRYPAEHQAEIRARVRSHVDHNFDSACSELYVHELLVRLGYQVEIHPPAPSGLRTCPDFLATDKGGRQVYVEAVVPNDMSAAELAEERRKGELYDLVDEIRSPYYFTFIDSVGGPMTAIPRKKWRTEIAKFLNNLPSERQPIRADVLEKGELLELSHEEWIVRIRAIPKQKSHGDEDGRTQGARHMPAAIVDDYSALRKAVVKKGSKYGKLELPFVVAVCLKSDFIDHDDILDALFGNEAVDAYDHGLAITRRSPNGAWTGQRGPRYTRISAALIGAIFPTYVATRFPVMYLHPHATHSALDHFTELPAQILLPDFSMQERHASINASDLFGLPETFPWEPDDWYISRP
jgi:hypothetical protein